MRILIVSGAFFPDNSPRSHRTTELAKEFSRLGHSVTLYVPEFHYDYSAFLEQFPNITLNRMSIVNETGKRIINERISYLWFRLTNLLFEAPYHNYYLKLPRVLRNESGYDLLVSIAYPHPIHWGIGRIYKKRKIAATWVADCGDPYMLSPLNNIPKMFYFKWVEKSWCKRCDYISVPTETSYLGYYKEFWGKIKVIPQGFDLSSIKLPSYQKNAIPTFAYAGGFIKGMRDPVNLLRFLSKCDKPFKFYMFNKGGEDLIAPFKTILGDKLVLSKPIPRAELLPILASMDFLINIGNGTNVQTPSKLIDYSIANRPILTVETDDVRENELNEFLEGNYEHKDEVIDISKYDIRTVAQHFLGISGEI